MMSKKDQKPFSFRAEIGRKTGLQGFNFHTNTCTLLNSSNPNRE